MAEVNQVTDWLEAHINQSCAITKTEDGDIDEVQMRLHKVTLAEVERRDPEDYVSNKTLLLHGTGTIHSGDHDVALPFDVYEIPVTDSLISKTIMNNELEIKTERARYTIKAIH